ncbi:hypothetical protein [Kribbella sp.]|uniref:hypothetical protein n=1 Tax=Kribbella sp. TaxID=1871183 RepID=UPI002D534F1E|nr:hypothetical protein [Kribbella sp.]HZX07140.1 hypothetical protein [Kribbella sp.]
MAETQRMLGAPKIMSGEINLSEYPHRYAVVHDGSGVKSYDEALNQVLTVVEVEEQRGWELVNITSSDLHKIMAVIRRR